ncbi:MAG TPA: CAP domain-containing protein [Solirubrobacterales bacterium]|nr:CAP domain-containing protein [Solirubrobacterales bacterium]
MQGRLLRSFLAAALSCAVFAIAAAGASGAVGVGQAAALEQPTARQALAAGSCPAGVGLDAPAALQEEAMRCLVNQTREERGLPPLADSPSLRSSALDKGRDLLDCNEFSHTACGREFSFWIRESGYTAAECWRVGENLAWGVDEQGTVDSILRAWMRSPTHRANILGDFAELGIDLRVGKLGGLPGVHLWVQHFGTHCGN